ncbi:homologue of Drosophila nmda1 protein [Plasmodium cynomolgi strain B]|uniref:Homologue of Drosophila nmda1 protein n=1 Tax=Plasmodium cynomolgi (strain B) TaxID=1120755 RepID=K6UF13_PLACD|nr:homologue of Drosophila nmda1 protein [Plasmodium cynomolgi strain B]GAB69301.1 homologue of Drosophila nmda1 protein [Plasmodium cynomolgi strain B]
MYNNQNGKAVPGANGGQSYGAVYNHGSSYNYSNYGQGQGKGNNEQKGYYYDAPTRATAANGGLYDEFSLNEFSSTKIRHGFIRKVYSILSIQLLMTFGCSALAVLYQPFNSFIVTNYTLFFILGVILSLPIMIALACSPNMARKYPSNYFLLLLITVGMTLIVTLASARTNSEIFFYAFGTTSVVVVGLTIFAFQTKWDFTGWYVYLFMAFLILMVLGIVGIFVRSKVFNLVFAGISAFLLSISIIVDTQLIIGGKHKKYEFSVDDYIFATLALYMDIINLFLSILSIFSNAD